MKTNVVGAVSFALFVGSGVLVAAGRRLPAGWNRQRAKNTFLIISLFVSLAAGLSQHDMWPFSSWKMLTGMTPPATPALPTLVIVGVDASGAEHEIDYRAWRPLSPEELHAWLKNDFYQLDPASRQRVAGYLLQLANGARAQALSADGLTFHNRLLGPLTAPTHILHPAIWSRVESVPRAPFVGLRFYNENWDLEERRLAPASVTRVLAYEYLSR